MNPVLPQCIWGPDKLHAVLLDSLDASFRVLRTGQGFDADWRKWTTVPGTKTVVPQTPLLGRGGQDRQVGGFWRFAQRYVESESGRSSASLDDRYSFERYQDFALYTAGDWYRGQKRPLFIAEVESNNAELLGELSGLLNIRCAFKYLFIYRSSDTRQRLSEFCAEPSNGASDWAGTTYWVIEIPDEPREPSSWHGYQAHLRSDGDFLKFEEAA